MNDKRLRWLNKWNSWTDKRLQVILVHIPQTKAEHQTEISWLSSQKKCRQNQAVCKEEVSLIIEPRSNAQSWTTDAALQIKTKWRSRSVQVVSQLGNRSQMWEVRLIIDSQLGLDRSQSSEHHKWGINNKIQSPLSLSQLCLRQSQHCLNQSQLISLSSQFLMIQMLLMPLLLLSWWRKMRVRWWQKSCKMKSTVEDKVKAKV